MERTQRRTGLGALPPLGAQWQMGKTAASISFVIDVEKFLAACQDKKKITQLKEAIQRVKNGQWILEYWLTAQEYLDQQVPEP